MRTRSLLAGLALLAVFSVAPAPQPIGASVLGVPPVGFVARRDPASSPAPVEPSSLRADAANGLDSLLVAGARFVSVWISGAFVLGALWALTGWALGESETGWALGRSDG